MGTMTYTLVLLRHGESEWNAKNLFTGWVDVALSEKGVEEAKRGGKLLRETIEERQANLSRKLSRAAQLLRTRVDVELEQQNRDLLTTMNERTRLQLMLQATVEGLSVAAISYYVVGLFGYIVKGAHDAGLIQVEPTFVIAGFVPLAALAIWGLVRHIRRSHFAGEH